MKKIIIMLMALCLAFPSIQATEVSKKEQKQIESMVKTQKKDLSKKGWTVMGSYPLDASLERHYTSMIADNKEEQVGFSTKTKSKNNGRLIAQSNAMNEYAGKWASQLKQRIVGDAQVESDNAEFEHFYSAYERLVESEIRGELQESFSLIRENNDGTYEIAIYYLIDTEKASKARMRALENAVKESEYAQKYADLISNFVREGF